MNVIFDVDGTLMDIEHRRHHVNNGNNNWTAFEDEMINDCPNHAIMDIALGMVKNGHEIVIVSARNKRHKAITETQLHDAGLYFSQLFVREDDDFRPDEVFKQDVLDALIAVDWKPDLVFDDRDSVVKMWRKNGLVCAQVAEGAF